MVAREILLELRDVLVEVKSLQPGLCVALGDLVDQVVGDLAGAGYLVDLVGKVDVDVAVLVHVELGHFVDPLA